MQLKLVVVEGDAKNTEIRLRLPAVIGRGRGSNLQIPQALVSRKHCELKEVDGKVLVKDLGSLNGTFIDAEKVDESFLLPGQLLIVGTMVFRADYQLASDMETAVSEKTHQDLSPTGGPGQAASATNSREDESTSLNANQEVVEFYVPDVEPGTQPSTIMPSTINAAPAPAVAGDPLAAGDKADRPPGNDDDEELRAFLDSLGKK